MAGTSITFSKEIEVNVEEHRNIWWEVRQELLGALIESDHMKVTITILILLCARKLKSNRLFIIID